MNQRIIYSDPTTGNVCVVIPTGEMTIQDVAKAAVPSGVAYQIVDVSDIPTDRAFRNAWKLEDDQITEDWVKSVEITKERLREERKPLFQAADVKAMRDIESTGAVSPETASLKQSLRDVTALADAAKSRDELLALEVAAFNTNA
jgi:hypothetical protein